MGPTSATSTGSKFFGDVADGIVRDLHPSSVLDAGCAMGFLVEALRKRGVDACGIDVSEYAISQVDESVADRCRVASLTEPLERRYDLITCIEVLEHIPPAEADGAIANLCAATDRLLLSTTPEDYGEATHLNVQPPEAWSAALAREGFLRDLDHDVSYLSPWAALYTRSRGAAAGDGPPLRPRLVAAAARGGRGPRVAAAKPRTSSPSWRPARARAAAALLAELDRRNEEILRLRDLLIGKDAELGAAKGRWRSSRTTHAADRQRRRPIQAARLRRARAASPSARLRGSWAGG